MIESYQINSTTDKILKRFSISINNYTLPINSAATIGKDSMGYVITSENEHELRRMKFGLTPYWAKTPMDVLTARAEGDKNQDNDPYYSGPNQIFMKPAFKKAIQHYRCLVIADGYIDNSAKHPQVISMSENSFPVVFAGLYDYWKDPLTGIIQPGFAIISTTACEILQQVGIKRMPVTLSFFNCISWIKAPKPLNYFLPLLDCNNMETLKITLDEKVNSENKLPIQNAIGQDSAPLAKRYYSKKQTHIPYDNSTIGERIEREKLLNS